MRPGFQPAKRYLDQGARCEALTPTLTSATSTRVITGCLMRGPNPNPNPSPKQRDLDEGARDDAHHVVQEAVALGRDGDHPARTLHRALQAQS